MNYYGIKIKERRRNDMNNQRRKELKSLQKQLELVKEMLERVRDDEEEYHDNIPDNLQDSERAMMSEEAIDTLTEIAEDLENSISELESII